MAKRLTPRQWRVYGYLKLRFEENESSFVTKEEICDRFKDDFPRWQEIENCVSEHSSVAFHNIRDDINKLRNSDSIYKVIISNSKGYKIATKKEAEEWLKSVKTEALKKLKMYWKNCRYASLNNQMQLVFNKEKDTIEVF